LAAFALQVLFTGSVLAGDLQKAPESVQAALFLKLLAFHKGISCSSSATAHVVHSKAFAREMEKGVGKKMGSAELRSVTSSDSMPVKVPSVLYVGSAKEIGPARSYARKHKVLLIAGVPGLATKGAALVVGTRDGKPKVLLNTTESKEQGAQWDAAILRIAEVIK
jgi:hypothetical protein